MVVCEIQWMLYLLGDLNIPQIQAAPLFYYSRSAKYIAENFVFHGKTKHIKLYCYIVRDRYLTGMIELWAYLHRNN